ncbi:MAG: sulfoxide reductase heme-binding subunit YedZ, partial [Gammaproteobacteria bacterium]|nr:sulfoxide reductase heme-binding subunit YedZ [Gammaproteobacteria bacterium]
MDKRNKAALHMTWVKRAKPVLFVLCLLPVAQLAYAAYRGSLGADPVETLTYATGDWTLRFLLITLAVTPLRYLTGIRSLVQLRRMLGLFAFFHVCLHFLVYVVFDQFFGWRLILEDILERRYIMVGMLGFMSLL